MISTPLQFPAALHAGAAIGDITPHDAVFLFGYPHVPRWSTGVHDRLECAALYLAGERGVALFLAHDLIFIPRAVALEARRRITDRTGVPESAIMLTATHTHSGPVTVEFLSNAADPIVPKPDATYLAQLCDVIVDTAVRAVAAAEPAELAFAVANATGVGTNRHDPRGPADSEVPVLLARSVRSGRPMACMIVHAMHPTVLHEDSTLISGDFPHFARQWLRDRILGMGCPVLYHQGASGNQSPRHVTRSNTFAEAQRLGEMLGAAIATASEAVGYTTAVRISARSTIVPLVRRIFPSVPEAERNVARARARFVTLQRAGAPAPLLRTAECDVFGAEETAELARAAIDGRLQTVATERTPAEIQAISLGPWNFVGWPGEFFVEYALELRRRSPGSYVVTLANGELQGYIVTPEAAAQSGYEASNAIFSADNGARFVAASHALLAGDA